MLTPATVTAGGSSALKLAHWSHLRLRRRHRPLPDGEHSAHGQTTLSFSFYTRCADTFAYDQQQAVLFDAACNTLKVIVDMCQDNPAWRTAHVDLTPFSGRSVLVWFNTHDDGGSNDPSYYYLDDVSVTNQ